MEINKKTVDTLITKILNEYGDAMENHTNGKGCNYLMSTVRSKAFGRVETLLDLGLISDQECSTRKCSIADLYYSYYVNVLGLDHEEVHIKALSAARDLEEQNANHS